MSLKEEVLNAAENYSLGTYAPDLILSKGEGCYLYDIDGNEYLDFASGIAVCNLGHCHPKVTKAIQEQAATLCHVSNLFYNEKQPELAKVISEKSFGGRVFFCNSGAEANEGMIKLARRWGSRSNKSTVICITNAFHGRTLGTLAATGKKKYMDGFSPNVSGFTHTPMNDLEALKAAYSDDCCAVMMEAVQGEGGIIPATEEFIKGVRELCDEKGMLMLIDEVQTGIGRTGTYFAYQHYGIEPDVLSMAKALGNGFPIGAFTAKQELNDVLVPGTHATTFGGNPLACAAALAVFKTFEEEQIIENCNEVGNYIIEKLKEITAEMDVEVRGLGMMIGVDLKDTCKVADVRKVCAESKLLVLPAGENVLRLLPPLTVTKAESDKAIAIIEQALKQVMEI